MQNTQTQTPAAQNTTPTARPQPKRGVDRFVDFLVRVLGLRVYGSSLLTRKANGELGALALFLFIQYIVDAWAWTRTWAYGLQGITAMPLVLGLVFATAILLFDRSVVIADTKNGRGTAVMMVARMLLVLALSAVTAVPVELAVFENEITTAIDNREKAAVDVIREKAVAEEQAKLKPGAVASANADEVAFRDVKRQELAQAAAKANDDAVKELRVGSATGRGHGAGPGYRALRTAADEAAQRLAAFDTETQTLVGKTKVEVEAKIEGLRTADAETLGNKYGGKWKQARGFLARYEQLEQLRAESSSVNSMVWGCRLVMVALGFLIMGLKLMGSSELKTYYTMEVQARHGKRVDLKELVAAETAQYRIDLKAAFQSAENALAQAELKLLNEALQLIQSGKDLPYGKIQGRLAQFWTKEFMPLVLKLQELQREAENAGVQLRFSQPVQDILDVVNQHGSMPWQISREDLLNLGWVEPKVSTATAANAEHTQRVKSPAAAQA